MAGAKSLFEDGDADNQEEPQLRVNEEYARRFEHNKKREELHRLQEKYPEQAAKIAKEHARQAAAKTVKTAAAQQAEAEDDEVSSSSDSSEDDDEQGLIDAKTQAQIFETILKIRQRDQSIYDAQTKFYSTSSDEEEDEKEGTGSGKGSKQERPMYLRDVMYKQAMEGGAVSSDEDEPAAGADAAEQQPRTYAQEQQELKQAFLTAFEKEVGGEGEDGEAFGSGVLQQRPGKKKRQDEQRSGGAGSDNEDVGTVGGGDAGPHGAADEERVQALLDSYFGRDAELSADDKFLKRYIMNKGWVEDGDDEDGEGYEVDVRGGQVVDDDEDKEFVEQAEQFEHAYNFRFEEPGGATIVTHPRNIEGTVRKSDDRRKRARAEKAARQAAEEEARRAEVRRLKNLKKADIDEKLQEIQGVAGRAAPPQEVLDALVAGDFDPEEYDRRMAVAFGDEYYAAGADEEDEGDLEDEAFERELEAMARYGSDDEDPQSFAALRRRLSAQRQQEAAAGKDVEGEEDEDEGEDAGGSEEADPEAAAVARAEVQRLLEEYYRLEYEDVVGGIPTRFRYKEVPADTFGLGVEEILGLDDKELNQVVGLKRLAPYREEHRRFRPNYQKLNQLRQERDEQQGQRQGGGRPFGSKQHQQQYMGQQRQKPKWKDRGGGQPRQQDGKSPQQDQQHEQQRPQKSAEERRLESFAKPTLKKGRVEAQGQQQWQEGGGNKRKRDEKQQPGSSGSQNQKQKQQQQSQQQQQQMDGGPTLSKAQKKNMKRAEKRAAKRAKVGGGKGGEAGIAGLL